MKSPKEAPTTSTPEAIARVHEPIGKKIAKETPFRTKALLVGAGLLGLAGVGHAVLGPEGSIDQDRYNRTGQSVSETVPLANASDNPKVKLVTGPTTTSTAETPKRVFGPEDPKGPTSISAFEPTGDVYQVQDGDNPWELVYTRLVDDRGMPIQGNLDPLVQDVANQAGEDEIFGNNDRVALPQGMHVSAVPHAPQINQKP